MDGNGFSGQGAMDTALQIAGRGIGGIAALADVWANRNPFGTLEKINALRQDPGFRQGAGPFAAGLVQVGGGRAPEVGPGMAGNIMQRAGISSGQYVPNFGPLPADVALQQQFAQMQAAALRNATPEQQQQAGLHAFGVTPSMTPEQMAQMRSMSGPNTRIMVPGPGGSRFTFGGPTPGTYFERDPEGFARQKRLEAQIAAGKAEAGMLNKPADVQTQNVMTQAQDITTQIDDLNGMLDDPEVKRTVEGIAEGRAGFLKYKIGDIFGSQGPVPTLFTTARELLRIESVGRFARMAGTRSQAVWKDLQVHPPQPGDSPRQIRAKLMELRKVIVEGAEHAAKTAQTPRGRLGELVPGPPPPSLTPPTIPSEAAPQVQTTPGGNTYRILPGP